MHYILALTLSTFAICTSEFVIMGLLPEIARTLNVTIPKAGILVTAYAMGVVIGAPVLAIMTSRLNRKTTLIGLLVIFIAGNILCAFAPTYELLLGARIITALCHGTFFGIASVVAADLSEPQNRAKAIAYVFMGATLANVLGVPLGTAVGQWAGWRATFFAVSLIGVAAIYFLKKTLPGNIRLRKTSPLTEFKALGNSAVLTALLLSILVNASLFTVFTYIAPILRDVTRVPPHAITFILLLFGVGLTVGSLLGGRLGGRKITSAIPALLIAAGICVAALRFTMPYAAAFIANLFVWSIFTFALSPILQLVAVDQAAKAPNLASTFNQSAFNFGNAVGAWIGSFMLSHRAGMNELPVAAAVIVAAAAGVSLYLKKAVTAENKPVKRVKA